MGDDPAEVTPKLHRSGSMIGAGERESADGQIGRAHRPHLLDAGALGRLVAGRDQVAHEIHRLAFRTRARHAVEPDELRHEDGNVGELPSGLLVPV